MVNSGKSRIDEGLLSCFRRAQKPLFCFLRITLQGLCRRRLRAEALFYGKNKTEQRMLRYAREACAMLTILAVTPISFSEMMSRGDLLRSRSLRGLFWAVWRKQLPSLQFWCPPLLAEILFQPSVVH